MFWAEGITHAKACETELRAFSTQAKVLFLKSEVEFILTHRRASIHLDYYYYHNHIKEENSASRGG